MDIEKEVIQFFKDLNEYAMKIAGNGGSIPGYKLVDKIGNRQWKDEAQAATELELQFGGDAYEKKLKSPAKAEALFGKGKKGKELFAQEMGALVEKPVTGTALVPVDDIREAREEQTVAAFNAVATVPTVDLSDLM